MKKSSAGLVLLAWGGFMGWGEATPNEEFAVLVVALIGYVALFAVFVWAMMTLISDD